MAEKKINYQRTNPKQYSYRFYQSTYHRKQSPNTEREKPFEDTGNPHHKVVIANTNSKNDKWTVADKIAFGMLVVTFFLTIFTYQLYHTAVHDSETADTSAKAAISAAIIAHQTLVATQQYDSASLIKQQKSIDDNNSSSQISFDRANKSLTLQDSSLKETQTQFEISNAPFLQVKIYDVSPIFLNKQIDVRVQFENLGNYPAKIIYSKTASATRNTPPDISFLKNGNKYSFADDNYITKGDTQFRETLRGIIPAIDQIKYDKLMSGEWFIYIGGIVKYKNLATNKYKFYEYMVKINASTNKEWQYTHNENFDIK
ncbi:hypothetical protein HDF18_15895 [Mucilaginibacter sp. X5P1]|uniref:hypothetical protein n=1 Tax=Mucilaginibacter sp. X5P1 TaxID=2723088 RepID=UPI00160B1047|nr:hypothetical protein [Mucilaginibacter sp. X5P1]MBB6139105.1 hypothetical protein [Mucilaginibacter sp. X5P1]